jgi:NAD(P)-dependent dehydrogenase (short-subunit alcohol dehydrogenase family)
MEGNILNLDQAKWSKTIETNLTSAFYLTKYVVPQMQELNKGSIVLMSSVQGISGFYNSTAYAASKGGIISMTRQLARDLATNKIRCNCISPGVIETEIFESIHNRDEMFQIVAEYTPLGHIGKPKDIANACLFLASDESEFITGINLIIDGGMSMRGV